MTTRGHSPTPSQPSLHEDFRRILDEHGHSFQYAVLKRAQQLRDAGRSPWQHPVEEFPVRVRNRSTHVDFLLSNTSWPALLVAECKRCDPNRRWGFARSPYASRDTVFERMYLDKDLLEANIPARGCLRLALEREQKPNVFHIGFEIGKGNQLKDAIAQVTTGANGMLEALTIEADLLKGMTRSLAGEPLSIVPVVFTTARLLITTVDLSSASLKTGLLPVGEFQASEVPWLFLTTNQSVDLKHERGTSASRPPRDLRDIIQGFYERTIAVVSPDGID